MAVSAEMRGRPPTFNQQTRQMLAELIRQHGAAGARKLSSIPISVATLLKIAREFGVELKKGRRKSLTAKKPPRETKRASRLRFEGETRSQLASLIRQDGVRRAREFSPVQISISTLLKIAREFGVKLKKGRRPGKRPKQFAAQN